jgi:phosphate-selective porin OprO/OprP
MMRRQLRALCLLACLVALPLHARAQEKAPADTPPPHEEPSPYDKLWRLARLYESDANPVIQSIVFSGQYQHDFVALDADQGDHHEWNVRRLRLGPRIRFLRRLQFEAEAELNPQEADPLYLRLTNFFVQWRAGERVVLTVGKQGASFTIDGSTSSKELIAIDRSNLSNNLWFPQQYVPGISLSGRRGQWSYQLGAYSAGEANREFGRFTGSLFALGTLGYDFAKQMGAKSALLAANYVYQQPDARNTFTRRLQHVASVNFDLEHRTWGLRADLTAAAGYLGQSDGWGLMTMPFVNLTDKLQIVGRYTLLDSAGANGVQLATYENRLVRGGGDRYDEGYAGLNYYFYGHKLKLQTGLQYADMDDRANDGGAYSGLSWTTGIRIGWP